MNRFVVAAPSLADLAAVQLTALCEATGIAIGTATDQPLGLLQRLMAPWGDAALAEPPRWPSVVGDDHTPYELSLALGASPEVRVLVEPLGREPSPRANRLAALAVLDELDVERRAGSVRGGHGVPERSVRSLLRRNALTAECGQRAGRVGRSRQVTRAGRAER